MDPDRQNELNALRPDLLRFARLQLRDAGAAEDAVQETLLAALTGSHRFESRSSYKTWLISILRNKIVDIIRDQSRELRQVRWPTTRRATSSSRTRCSTGAATGRRRRDRGAGPIPRPPSSSSSSGRCSRPASTTCRRRRPAFS
jgi:RNA polymerase sigma factor (sigma-70 family)